jgi:hypothetical protein
MTLFAKLKKFLFPAEASHAGDRRRGDRLNHAYPYVDLTPDELIKVSVAGPATHVNVNRAMNGWPEHLLAQCFI